MEISTPKALVTSCSQDKELREIRARVHDREAELDTLRKAGKNLRERLDEKEVETRGIMDRVGLLLLKCELWCKMICH